MKEKVAKVFEEVFGYTPDSHIGCRMVTVGQLYKAFQAMANTEENDEESEAQPD